MKEKYVSDLSLVVTSILSLLFGILILIIPIYSSKILHTFSYITIITISLLSLITLIFKHQRNNTRTITLLIIFLFGILIYIFPNFYIKFFPIVLGIFLLILGLFKMIFWFLMIIQKNKHHWKQLFSMIINYSTGIILTMNKNNNFDIFIILCGIYLILLGITFAYDFLKINYPDMFKKIKRRYRTTSPIILSFNKPYEEYKKFSEEVTKNVTKITMCDENKDLTPDIEVVIHVKEKYPGKYGHADIIIGNDVYSYGNYDKTTWKLFRSIGDGVLFKADRDGYFKYCTETSKKMIFCFGLKLTPEQIKLVNKKINTIFKSTYEWEPKSKKDPANKDKYNDYASTLSKNMKINFYKFKKGIYRIYFIFNTNCVKLVDDILGSSGLDLLKVGGFIIPGTYFEYLNNQFKLKNSNVISKTIYVYKDK